MKKLFSLVAFVFILSGCGAQTTPIQPVSVPTKYPVSAETAAKYEKWLSAKTELDKLQEIIAFNLDKYLEYYFTSISLCSFYKYDDALEAVHEMAKNEGALLEKINSLQPQKEYPNIAKIKTLLISVVQLEKQSGEYLEKYIIAVKAGRSGEAQKNLDLYIKYYKDAMAKNREFMDLYVETLLQGGPIEGQKLIEENTPKN